jgi:hypothetical protein
MDDPTVIVVPPNTMPRIGTLYKTQAKYNSEDLEPLVPKEGVT